MTIQIINGDGPEENRTKEPAESGEVRLLSIFLPGILVAAAIVLPWLLCGLLGLPDDVAGYILMPLYVLMGIGGAAAVVRLFR